jgi:hypothetical protein
LFPEFYSEKDPTDDMKRSHRGQIGFASLRIRNRKASLTHPYWIVPVIDRIVQVAEFERLDTNTRSKVMKVTTKVCGTPIQKPFAWLNLVWETLGVVLEERLKEVETSK